MEYLRSRPFAIALVCAGVLIIIGTIIVLDRINGPESSAPVRAWGGSGGYLLSPTGQASAPMGGSREDNIFAQVQSGPPFHYGPVPATSAVANEDELNLDSLLSLLSSAGNPTSEPLSEETSLDAYAFIPSGLISSGSKAEPRTPIQQDLYNYGNEVGSTIQSFESLFRNSPQILKDQFEDRQNAAKNEALLSLAQGLAGVGISLERMENVPEPVRTAHGKVAASYRALGEKLAEVPKARTEQAILDAMLSYNTSVEAYIKNYVSLATIISAYDVKFAPEDPGSVFVFTNVSF